MHDPKTLVKTKEKELDEAPSPMAGMSIADLVMALKAAAGNDDDSMQKRATYEAEAHKRLNRRENETHPGINAFSYPEGNVARPKAELKCKMAWVGYPLDEDTLTPQEIDALNLATPGEYLFTKTDGSKTKLEVKGQHEDSGKLSHLQFLFACRGENRHNLPTMTATLNEVFRGETEIDALRAEIARLKAVAA